MSFTLSDVRQLAVTGAVAAVAVGAAASSAQAASKPLTYSGQFPLLDAPSPVAVTHDVPVPKSVKSGLIIDSVPIKAGVSIGGTGQELFRLVRAASVEGTAIGEYAITTPDGGSVQISVPLRIPATIITPATSPVVFNAKGLTPALTFDTRGTYTVKATALSLNLTARDAQGEALALATPDGTEDSDGDPLTFDVSLALSPSTQNTQLDFFKVH